MMIGVEMTAMIAMEEGTATRVIEMIVIPVIATGTIGRVGAALSLLLRVAMTRLGHLVESMIVVGRVVGMTGAVNHTKSVGMTGGARIVTRTGPAGRMEIGAVEGQEFL